jgi:hypothetical protein
MASHSGGHTLWLGSANATQRGWLGPNTEVVAKLSISETLANGIEAFIEVAKPIQLSDISDFLDEEIEQELLERARIEVATRWKVHQKRHPEGPLLISRGSFHPDHPEILFEVGLITGEYKLWPRGEDRVQLSPIPKSKETELVKVRLSLGDTLCSWVQKAPLNPKLDEERDRHALAAHLDPRTFLLWIRSLLNTGELQDGGGEWHSRPSSQKSGRAGELLWWAPTLEEVLSAWTRNPKNLEEVDKKVGAYLELIRWSENAHRYTDEELRTLDKFEQAWSVIRKALIAES